MSTYQLQPGAIAFRDNQVEIPFITTVYPDERPVSLALLVDPAGTVVASSYPGRYPPGSSERDQKLTSRIEPIQEHCDRTKIKKGFA